MHHWRLIFYFVTYKLLLLLLFTFLRIFRHQFINIWLILELYRKHYWICSFFEVMMQEKVSQFLELTVCNLKVAGLNTTVAFYYSFIKKNVMPVIYLQKVAIKLKRLNLKLRIKIFFYHFWFDIFFHFLWCFWSSSVASLLNNYGLQFSFNLILKQKKLGLVKNY